MVLPANQAGYSTPNTNSCGWQINAFGFTQSITFPTTNRTYRIFRSANFRYLLNGAWAYCVDTLSVFYNVPPPCPINEPEVTVNGLVVTLKGPYNPCNDPSIKERYAFEPLDGNPVIVYPTGTTNTVQLTYSCQGDKKVKISYNQDGCVNTKVIIVHPIDPNICCKVNDWTTCSTHYPIIDGNDKITVKLKERLRKIVAITRNFKKVGSGYKRRRTSLTGSISGPVTYKKDACDCKGVFNFIPKDIGPVNRRKFRVKLLWHTQRTAIEALEGVPSFYWFKHNWARKVDNPWKFSVSTSEIPIQVFKIDCNDNCGQ